MSTYIKLLDVTKASTNFRESTENSRFSLLRSYYYSGINRLRKFTYHKKCLAATLLAGLLVAFPAYSEDSLAVENGQGDFTLNMPNADISALISLVSRRTGKNFIVDPRVKAKVTVISSTPTNASELYEVFLSVLQVHGFAAVPQGDLIKILPEVTARTGPVPDLLSDMPANSTSDQLVTHVIKVNNVPAAQLVPILRPLVPQQGHLAAYTATNSLIITDRAGNINRLLQIINRIDIGDSGKVEIVRLKHASAAEIIRIVNSLEGQNRADGSSSLNMASDERTNSLILSGDTASRMRVRGLIANLDTPLETGGNTKVVYLKYAKADELVNILNGVSQGQSKVGVSVDGAANSLSPVNAPAAAGGETQQQQRPQVANTTQGNVQASNESNIDIQADPQTNALIITAPPGEMKNILAVVRQLDIRRAQVLVEAIIAEVSENTARELGAGALVGGSTGDPLAASNLGGILANAAATYADPTQLAGGLSMLLGNDGSNTDIGFVIRAIASDSENNILSTPSLVTLDNEEASIVVGSNVPIITSSEVKSGNNPFQTIERKDVGIKLKIKPQINEGDTIKLVIEQEVSQVESNSSSGAADIVTSKRTINTSVLIDDGQTLVLGGLIDDSSTESKDKVPLLGDIPILGKLFQYKKKTRNKRNLMVFIHPTILRDARTAQYYSSEKYNYLRSKQLMSRQKELDTRSTSPALPELDVYFNGKRVSAITTKQSNLPSSAALQQLPRFNEGNLSN